MSNLSIVLDANILVRAVLGRKVKNLLMTFSQSVTFFTPDVCIEEAKKYLPIIFEKRNLPIELALEVFDHLVGLLEIVDKSIYQAQATSAQQRMKDRDVNDWPIVATALTFNSPIWTEDQDFFGSGVPTWTTDRIHLFLKSGDN